MISSLDLVIGVADPRTILQAIERSTFGVPLGRSGSGMLRWTVEHLRTPSQGRWFNYATRSLRNVGLLRGGKKWCLPTVEMSIAFDTTISVTSAYV